MSTSIDLTEERCGENTSAASKNGSGSSSPAPPIEQTGSRSKVRLVPKHYVCKRCKVPGHHITQCPTLLDKKFDSKPPHDYSCHACGMKGDHFIHTCPKKIPKGLLKKKKVGMRNQAERESSGFNPNLSPLGPRWDQTSAPREQPEASGKPQKLGRKTTGHIRKRSDDIEFVSQSRKRFKPEAIENYDPVVLEDSPPQLASKELAVRTRPRQEGRLSPWYIERNDDDDTSVESPPFAVDTVGFKSDKSLDHRDSRAQRVAKLKATSFLAELESNIEDDKVHDFLTTQSQFPSLNELLADFDVPPQQEPTESPSERSETSQNSHDDFASKFPGTDDSGDTDLVNSVHDPRTPTPPPTPPTPPIIEPYVTQKVLSSPRYDAHTRALFTHTPNFWVRKPKTRDTALSLWAMSDRDDPPQGTWAYQTVYEDCRKFKGAAYSHNVSSGPSRR